MALKHTTGGEATGQWLRNALKGKVKGRCKLCALASRSQTKNKMSTHERVYRLSIINRAKAKNISVGISLKDFVEIASKECTYCGSPPFERNWEGKNKYMPSESFTLNGIDRLDSDKGYIKDNCVPCCRICNTAKGQLSVDEFKKHIRSIYERI